MTMRIVDKTKECEKEQLEKRNLIVALYGGVERGGGVGGRVRKIQSNLNFEEH